MVRKWANLSDVGDAIEQTISSILQERGLEPGAITDHAELNQEIIDQTFDRVEYLLRRNSVTGAYLIPVSYTHLDVYKRQQMRSWMKRLLRSPFMPEFLRNIKLELLELGRH